MAGYDATVAIGKSATVAAIEKVKQNDGYTVGDGVAPIQKPLNNSIMTENGATVAIEDTGKIKPSDGHGVGASLAYTPNIFGDNSAHLTEKQRRGSVFC